MKKLAITLFVFISINGISFADEIHLQGDVVLKGKVIQVTEKHIEYDPEGARPFDLCPKDQVIKIVYSDGRVEEYSFKDEIFLFFYLRFLFCLCIGDFFKGWNLK